MVDFEPRYKRVNTCKECDTPCTDQRCDAARIDNPRPYLGVRLTSDGFDCALPVSIDSHSHCSYACLYCFSDNLVQHRAQVERPIGQMSLTTVESLFSGRGGRVLGNLRKALKYHDRNAHGYPCPVQVGAINDPCDHIERQQGWLFEFIRLAIKYGQPVRISTKGSVFLLEEYQAAIAKAPELFWVAFSIISPDDELMAKVDRRAPVPSERLKTMAALHELGVKTSLRFRPIMPGISDKTARYPRAWQTLIQRAADAGAGAISYEVGFVPGLAPKDIKSRWQRLSALAGVPFIDLYAKFGKRVACMRPPYTWTEDIMHAIREEAHKQGMTVGVSDPVWKQLGDVGCCCGIAPDDPVFGNWQRESATNQLLIARDTGKVLGPDDITPAWAHDVRWDELCNPNNIGPLGQYKRRHRMWADYLRDVWNDVSAARGPLHYFQGALLPDHVQDGDVFYKYVGLKRKRAKAPYWQVDHG